jgi:hypothetical protein
MARKKLAVSPARARALPGGGIFYYRAEHNDHNFLEHFPRGGPFDAALVASRYLAPYPPKSKPASWGLLVGNSLTRLAPRDRPSSSTRIRRFS